MCSQSSTHEACCTWISMSSDLPQISRLMHQQIYKITRHHSEDQIQRSTLQCRLDAEIENVENSSLFIYRSKRIKEQTFRYIPRTSRKFTKQSQDSLEKEFFLWFTTKFQSKVFDEGCERNAEAETEILKVVWSATKLLNGKETELVRYKEITRMATHWKSKLRSNTVRRKSARSAILWCQHATRGNQRKRTSKPKHKSALTQVAVLTALFNTFPARVAPVLTRFP